jgi:hypothetical protein
LSTASETTEARKKKGRSRLSNGHLMAPPRDGGIDGRSCWARRQRDLINEHVSDLGGAANMSGSEQRLVRICATLTTELEQLDLKFALGNGSPAELDQYQRTSNTLRRHFETLGLRRVPRDVTVDLKTYLSVRANDKASTDG